MRRTTVLVALLISLCCTLPVEAKFIFRDGQWVFAPDDEEPRPAPDTRRAPAPGPAVTPEPTHDPEPAVTTEPTPTPEPAPEPVEMPQPVPAPDPIPAPEPSAAPPPVDVLPKPADTTGASHEPAVAATMQPEPGTRREPASPRIPRPSEPAEDIPDVPPAALEIAPVESVGETYRHPAASRAADEAERMIAALAPDAEEARLIHDAIRQFRNGRYSRARRSAARLLKKHPMSPYRQAAQWLQAEALFSSGAYYKAYEAYADFVKGFAGSDVTGKAMRRQVECAEALLGPARRKVLGMPLLSGDDEALAILEKVYAQSPTGPLAADAIFRIAEYHMDHGQFEEAEEMLRAFLDQFPNHSRARQAQLWSAQCAMAANLGPTYDDSGLKRAEDTLTAYRNKYPAMAAQENVAGALARIRMLRARKKLQTAAYYRRAQRPKAAAFYARLVVEHHAGTPAAAEAQAMLDELEGD